MSSSNAVSAINWESRFFAFLHEELAPSAARWRATLRLSVLCALATTLIMALHIPDGEFLIITLFVVAQSDARASLTKALLRVVGTLLGGALALLAILSCADKPWILFPLQALVIATALFLSRTTTVPYAALLGGITFLIVMPEYIFSPELSLEKALWRIALTAVGAVLGTVGQLWLWPDDPEARLLQELAGRIRFTETVLDRVLGEVVFEPAPDGRRAAHSIAITGLARQLDLLASAEAGSRSLEQRHTEQIKLITDVELLVLAALRLDRLCAPSAAPLALASPMHKRLQDLRHECARLRRALEQGRPPEARAAVPAEGIPQGSNTAPELLATIHEMERALTHLPVAMAFLGEKSNESQRASALPGLWREAIAKQPVFTPACSLSNSEAIRFALKGALAASICGLIYLGFAWPGISTCVMTVMVVAQSSVGASLRKSLLRFTGAALGGLAALTVIVGLMPNMESLASLLVVTTALFAAAAWLTTGSSRISYIGLQMAIALCLVLIDSLAPTTDLTPAGNRLLGILLGITMMDLIDFLLWPVFAGPAMRRKLTEVLRRMAEAQRLTSQQNREQIRATFFAIYRDLTSALSLQDDVLLEPSSRAPDAEVGSHSLLRVASGIQETFLALLSADRHRFVINQEAVPRPVLERMNELDEAIARHLEALAARLEGEQDSAAADTSRRISDFDEALNNPLHFGITDTQAAAQLEDHFVLYRELVASLMRLEGDIRAATEGSQSEIGASSSAQLFPSPVQGEDGGGGAAPRPR